ncbi:MAG: hypothetical protein M0Z78_06610 [Betaproteobacteria bacterium]|nr:hypothetical protein [Betaproteobacteria bacterium]
MLADKRLKHLWGKRDDLTEAGWADLYQLIFGMLKRSNPSILRSLPESKEHYIQDFFLIKVFEPAKHNSSCPRGGNELCSYFNNYLIDVYRGADLRITDLVENHDEIGYLCAEAGNDQTPADGEFFEYGFGYREVHQRARAFLDQMDDIGRVYLALHACADAPEPLYRLAERLRIPSYHYRAHQLGITRRKGEFGKGYEVTQIGKWLVRELGLELGPNSAVLAALKILCFESLQQYQ